MVQESPPQESTLVIRSISKQYCVLLVVSHLLFQLFPSVK